MVDPKDREAYEQGQTDAEKPIIDNVINDAVDAVPGMSNRDQSQDAAYFKGRRGEQLDEDKDESAESESDSDDSESEGGDDNVDGGDSEGDGDGGDGGDGGDSGDGGGDGGE